MRPDVPSLPVPAFFDPARVGEVWRVPYQDRAAQAEDWAVRHAVRPASQDSLRICLVLVDCQNTFCIPGFELFVAGRSGRGAVDDNVRLCEFIYRHLGRITDIVASMDTHTSMQIFHSVFLVDERGAHPPAYTTVSLADIESGRWKINSPVAASIGMDVASLQQHLVHYACQLAEGGKYQLMIWPYHAMLGGIGHALVSAVEEAVFFHTIARRSQARFSMKGDNSLVENYSILHPEVLFGANGQRIASSNAPLLESLLSYDRVIVAGQAKSHCVAWTVDDLLGEIGRRDPRLARKVYLLEDCTSPVVAPGADFTEQADAAFARFASAGVNVVRSTVPMADWPGFSSS